jgi:hypothetical protein
MDKDIIITHLIESVRIWFDKAMGFRVRDSREADMWDYYCKGSSIMQDALKAPGQDSELIYELGASLALAKGVIEVWFNNSQQPSAEDKWGGFQKSPDMVRINAALGQWNKYIREKNS